MVIVVITGGSGFVAQHLIKHLQENVTDIVSEIRTIDRKQFTQYLSWPNRIPLHHFASDISNASILEKVLTGADVVIHLARKSLELTSIIYEKNLSENYWKYNFQATEMLLNAMLTCSVAKLIFVGDAFANLPNEDNFGLSEDIHPGLPETSFLLGDYGESLTKAELLGRSYVGKELKDGKTFHAHFLRPTFIYGEGHTKLINALKTVCELNNGTMPYAGGSSRGMLQYVYAGNLAGFIESSLRNLLNNPDWCNGEYFYCTDETKAHKFKDFIAPVVEALGYKVGPERNFFLQYTSSYCADLLTRYAGITWLNSGFSNISFRFLFGYSLGFLSRKHDLLFKYRPQVDYETHIGRLVKWCEKI
uniref:3-beta hydroxysteroid dehydrogenase/isomerase domain-containing protein n=1 Tax=Acrobeloides nanus TaxID=290746 RepID=A0A914DPL5_9BILA